MVERLIIPANRATQGLIMIFFTSSIASLIVVCFLIVSLFGLNDTKEHSGNHIIAPCYILIAVLYLIRIYCIMESGQRVAIKVKQSRRALEDVLMIKEMESLASKGNCDKLYVLHKRLEVYQYIVPIAPYTVFTLNNKTFCTTLASVITYIVILIKLRGVETSKTTPEDIFVNDTSHF